MSGLRDELAALRAKTAKSAEHYWAKFIAADNDVDAALAQGRYEALVQDSVEMAALLDQVPPEAEGEAGVSDRRAADVLIQAVDECGREARFQLEQANRSDRLTTTVSARDKHEYAFERVHMLALIFRNTARDIAASPEEQDR